jgi:hypothetical protein
MSFWKLIYANLAHALKSQRCRTTWLTRSQQVIPEDLDSSSNHVELKAKIQTSFVEAAEKVAAGSSPSSPLLTEFSGKSFSHEGATQI